MLARAKELLTDVYSHQLPLGTWPGDEIDEQPVEAQEVWGPWMPHP